MTTLSLSSMAIEKPEVVLVQKGVPFALIDLAFQVAGRGADGIDIALAVDRHGVGLVGRLGGVDV